MKMINLGRSHQGHPLLLYRWVNNGPEVLILGGMHGNETEGVTLAWSLIDWALEGMSLPVNLSILPVLNPDGVLSKSRTNGRNVDLNRNWPTQDWTAQILNPRYPPGPHPASENETQALLNWFKKSPPQMIFNLHSWNPVLNVNGECENEAKTLQDWLGYPITQEIGYSTPGCMGTYCGLEHNMPTLTYEIERGLSADLIIQNHRPALIESIKTTIERLQICN